MSYCIHTLHGFIECPFLYIERQTPSSHCDHHAEGATYLSDISDDYIFKPCLCILKEFGKVFTL